MKNLGINLVLGLGTVSLCGAALLGMNSDKGKSKGGRASVVEKKDELQPAIETLQKELTRRFTERTNVDFGFSRVIRSGSRFHFGPTMEIQGRGMPSDMRMNGNKVEAKDPSGNWKPITNPIAEMHAENDVEKSAIATLLNSHRDVGIYTFGLFDTNQVPKRIKGAAVLNQFAAQVPRADSLDTFATRAWRSGSVKYHEFVNGFDLYAMKVGAADETCVSCHQGMIGQGTKLAKGDSIGMFVIAVAQPNTPMAKQGS